MWSSAVAMRTEAIVSVVRRTIECLDGVERLRTERMGILKRGKRQRSDFQFEHVHSNH